MFLNGRLVGVEDRDHVRVGEAGGDKAAECLTTPKINRRSVVSQSTSTIVGASASGYTHIPVSSVLHPDPSLPLPASIASNEMTYPFPTQGKLEFSGLYPYVLGRPADVGWDRTLRGLLRPLWGNGAWNGLLRSFKLEEEGILALLSRQDAQSFIEFLRGVVGRAVGVTTQPSNGAVTGSVRVRLGRDHNPSSNIRSELEITATTIPGSTPTLAEPNATGDPTLEGSYIVLSSIGYNLPPSPASSIPIPTPTLISPSAVLPSLSPPASYARSSSIDSSSLNAPAVTHLEDEHLSRATRYNPSDGSSSSMHSSGTMRTDTNCGSTKPAVPLPPGFILAKDKERGKKEKEGALQKRGSRKREGASKLRNRHSEARETEQEPDQKRAKEGSQNLLERSSAAFLSVGGDSDMMQWGVTIGNPPQSSPQNSPGSVLKPGLSPLSAETEGRSAIEPQRLTPIPFMHSPSAQSSSSFPLDTRSSSTSSSSSSSSTSSTSSPTPPIRETPFGAFLSTLPMGRMILAFP